MRQHRQNTYLLHSRSDLLNHMAVMVTARGKEEAGEVRRHFSSDKKITQMEQVHLKVKRSTESCSEGNIAGHIWRATLHGPRSRHQHGDNDRRGCFA